MYLSVCSCVYKYVINVMVSVLFKKNMGEFVVIICLFYIVSKLKRRYI